MKDQDQKIEFIKDVVLKGATISYGGTSTGCIALACSKAASLLKAEVFYATVFISPFIYLNSAHIGVPKLGRGNLKKIVAAGLVLKNPSKGLHVLNDLDKTDIKKVCKMSDNPTLINIEVQYNTSPIFCRVIAIDSKSNVADVVISDEPTNFSSVKFNNKQLVGESFKHKMKEEIHSQQNIMDSLLLSEVYDLCKKVKINQLKFLDEQIKTNLKLCNDGLKFNKEQTFASNYSDAVKTLLKSRSNDKNNILIAEILSVISSGIDARMNGCPLPAYTSATNGDHGVAAILIPLIYGQHYNLSKEKIYQSILLSHYVTCKITSKIGKLSHMCGTAIAAVSGALAGVTFLKNWPWKKVNDTLNMHLAQQAGTICYGSSTACAFQVITAIINGFYCIDLVDKGGFVPDKDGIISENLEVTLNNLKHYALGTQDQAVNIIVGNYQTTLNKKGR